MSLWASSHLLQSVIAQDPSVNATLPAPQAGLDFLCESLSQQLAPMQCLGVSQHTSLLASVFIQQLQEETARYCSMLNQSYSAKQQCSWRWEELPKPKVKPNKYNPVVFHWSSWVLGYHKCHAGSPSGSLPQLLVTRADGVQGKGNSVPPAPTGPLISQGRSWYGSLLDSMGSSHTAHLVVEVSCDFLSQECWELHNYQVVALSPVWYSSWTMQWEVLWQSLHFCVPERCAPPPLG